MRATDAWKQREEHLGDQGLVHEWCHMRSARSGGLPTRVELIAMAETIEARIPGSWSGNDNMLCPHCGRNLALVGRVRRCVPMPAAPPTAMLPAPDRAKLARKAPSGKSEVPHGPKQADRRHLDDVEPFEVIVCAGWPRCMLEDEAAVQDGCPLCRRLRVNLDGTETEYRLKAH